MVMVPGINDSENNIRATSNFLKLINHSSIELMKYHNMYEEKARCLGLDVISLNITPGQARESINNGIQLFKKYGIKAENIESDSNSTVSQTFFTQRVKDIQNDIRESKRALCLESAKLKTKYYRKNGFKKPVPIHRAEHLSYLLKNKEIKIYPKELLVGNFTSKRVAGQLWEEYFGTLYILSMHKLGHIAPIPFQISFKDKLYFYFRIFPFWLNRNLLKKIVPNMTDFWEATARSAEMMVGFNNNSAGIAHFIVNFDRILELGTSGLIEEVKRKQKEHPENDSNFYDGIIIALKGLEMFSQRYAKHIMNLSKTEENPDRRRELEEISKICEHVPKYPARTFHEALQSILFLHIGLCMEAYENAISFGRLDQILYPYYKKDKEVGRITYEKAKELICLFVLKINELVLVNGGNSFPDLYSLFETDSTDQALTFGGVDKEGNDATNDVTYMFIDACELRPVSIDMGARIHKNSPERYLKRLAEVYISGCPVPQLFSDDIYIKTLQKHYPTTLENARNYSIVGCVEPVASDDHFGNTDCANVNLAMPFLQALKGHNYDLWNYKGSDNTKKLRLLYIKNIFRGNNFISRAISSICDKSLKKIEVKKGLYTYNPPSNMDELLSRFQKRLNKITESILRDHQNIEKLLRERYTTPLTSSLFNGCLESGKDVYEGGTTFNSSGIQAVGVTDVADSLYAIYEVVYKEKLFSLIDIITAIDSNFQGAFNQKIREELLKVPKFGDDSSSKTSFWVSKVMEIYNNALDSVDNCPRNGKYTAGYYALNVCNVYGKNTQALPSGRKKGEPLANSITPHYNMEETDLLSALNSISRINFTDFAPNGTTATLTIDSALFQGRNGVNNLANIFKTFLTTGGMQLQPNIINRDILLDAYNNPDKYKYLIIRIAGYCTYFNDLSDEMKLSIINRTSYG